MTTKINSSSGIIATSLPTDTESKTEQKEWFRKQFPSPLALYSTETNDMKKLADQKGTSKERTATVKRYFENIFLYVANTGTNKKS